MDAAHVRNALARFDQVDFESDAARERARLRLLRAAKRFRIVPIGFISNQLRSERELGHTPIDLPTGFVTMLMTDIEQSTGHLERLGDGYEQLLDVVRSVQRSSTEQVGGCVVETRADEFFAVFDCPAGGLDAAIAAQRLLAEHRWPDGIAVRIRSGIHAGYPTVSADNYIGMAVHATARICSLAHGGQIVMSADMRTALTDMMPPGVRLRSLGTHRLRGIPEPTTLYHVLAEDLPRE
jgi:class 3 adenylate cyclase